MDLLDEPEEEAKPERRANHRVQQGSDPAAELRAPGEADGAADATDSSDATGGSSDGDGHAAMDELLASDDSMSAERSEGADADGAAAEGAVGGVGGNGGNGGLLQQLPGQGKRKRGAPGASDGGGETGAGTKKKRGKVDLPLAGLSVTGSKQVPSGKNGLKQAAGDKKATGGKKAKQQVKGSRVTNGEAVDAGTVHKAPAESVKPKRAAAKGKKSGPRPAKAAASPDGHHLAKPEAASGGHPARAVRTAATKKPNSKVPRGRVAGVK